MRRLVPFKRIRINSLNKLDKRLKKSRRILPQIKNENHQISKAII